MEDLKAYQPTGRPLEGTWLDVRLVCPGCEALVRVSVRLDTVALVPADTPPWGEHPITLQECPACQIPIRVSPKLVWTVVLESFRVTSLA
jgi:hypothetical protein